MLSGSGNESSPVVHRRGTVRACISALLGLAIAAVFVDTFLVRGLWMRMVVHGVSMGEEVEGRRVLVDRSAFLWRTPRRDEAVVLRSPDDPGMLCIKRVVGLPGEVVEMVGGTVYVDGSRAETAESRCSTHAASKKGDILLFQKSRMSPFSEVSPFSETQYRLGREEYFLLGDNRARSLDSRVWSRRGGVREGMLLGPALAW